MKNIGCFILLIANFGLGENHVNPSFSTHTNSPHATAVASTIQEKADEEYANAKQDKGGCLWREEDWQRSERDPSFKEQMDRICEAEKIAIDKTNQDRTKHCKNPLKLDQRLSYVSRLNSIRLLKAGGVKHPNPHSAWQQKLPQKWFKEYFPAAAQLMKFERENMWGMGGGPHLKNMAAGQLAAQAVSSWIHSPGHHAPMIDCNNRFVGVGFFYDPDRSEWVGYMSFAE